MSDPEDSLNRLWRAAARAERGAAPAPPPGFATRVLADCRPAPETGSGWPAVALLCRRALLGAGATALLCVAVNLPASLRQWDAWHAPEARFLPGTLLSQLP